MTEHRSLTGNQLHEPKGAETATADQVYVSNGAGSGVWTSRFSGINNLNTFAVGARFTDISTPSSVFVIMPIKANVVRISGVLDGPIATNNSVITVYKNKVFTGVTLNVPYTSSTAGTVAFVNLTPTLAVAEGDVLELRCDGESSGVASFNLSFKLTAVA